MEGSELESEEISSEETSILEEDTIKDLLAIVETKNWEYSIPEIIQSMLDKEYDPEGIGSIIYNALIENIFHVSSIDDDGVVWLALNSDGDNFWDEFYKGQEGYSED